jgi:triacylglycerol esterase/lipase EstA (alpha/beta hydrolase family)
MSGAKYPVIYVRGYAGTQADVEETVDDPFYGFNMGSTHIRADTEGEAQFYAFESPFVRLLTEHGYTAVFDGTTQRINAGIKDKAQTIWIYRYYDPTSKTYDRPGGRRLSIEEAAAGLREFIEFVRAATGAPKVHLVAHSMGGLVCRSLLQRTYPKGSAQNYVDKLFTYGTPHGGIHFIDGGGLEKVRDLLGVNNSDDFGRDRMYAYLTPAGDLENAPPKAFDQTVIPPEAFDTQRVFCVVGTNAADYEVARGMSRTVVGPQSDGLVQIESASVAKAPRAYVHRSHSGRYGMVNSEEGYQNLRRFLFGDVRVHMVIADFDLDYSQNAGSREVTYQFEIQVALRGSLIVMHDRSEAHYSAVSLNKDQYVEQMAKGGLPLYTTFMLAQLSPDGTMRYMVRVAVYSKTFEHGFLSLTNHVERLPLWSDYMIAELRPSTGGTYRYEGYFQWASLSVDPDKMTKMDTQQMPAGTVDGFVPLPDRGRQVLGKNARIRLETSNWS